MHAQGLYFRSFEKIQPVIYFRSDPLLFSPVKNYPENKKFLKDHPEIPLPPDDLMYESFQINYNKYYLEGKQTASWLAGHLWRHKTLENIHILDWGCGPGRIIRHLPELLGKNNVYYGTDYNKRSIEWCRNHIADVNFNLNTLDARLPYNNSQMDVIYGISVFTHLSEKKHEEWYRELMRILKPGGVLLLTTQGDNFIPKLTDTELVKYNAGQLIVRGNVKEGHRTYSAFHPKKYMYQLFADTEILEHITEKPIAGRWLPQDIWIVRKSVGA